MEIKLIMVVSRYASQWIVCLLCLSSISFASGARADKPFDYKLWNFISNTGNYLFLGSGVALPLIEDGRAGRNHALRTADALGVSVLFAEGFKSVITEKWPNGTTHRSFPSGHSAAAFAVATVESAQHPNQSIYWYTGASLIAASRVGIHVHTVADILAGSALGYGVGRWEVSSRRGLLLAPLIQPDTRTYGLVLSRAF